MTKLYDDEDVIDFLHRQHEEISALFTALQTAAGDERTTLFRELMRLLAVHETAEEEVVHPAVRRIEGGDEVVDARLGEEHRAKDLLSTLDAMGADAKGFDTLMEQLREDVLAHAEHEEQQEFPLLRAHLTTDRLHKMALTAKLAEDTAPTHPHPGVESAKANLLLGPPAAIMDRARDAIRTALNR